MFINVLAPLTANIMKIVLYSLQYILKLQTKHSRFVSNARSDGRQHGRQVDVDAVVRRGGAAGARGLLRARIARARAATALAQRARWRRRL